MFPSDACPGATAVDSTTGADEPRLPEGGARRTEADTDAALAAAFVGRGDRAAFARLVERHQAYVFRLAVSVLGIGGEGDAEDVAQEVFIRLAGHLQDFRGESTFRTWLRRLALNLAIDRRRRARWRKPHVDAAVLDDRLTTDAADDPYLSAEAAERRRTVGQCLDALPDAARSVIHLHYWLDLSVDEIARMLHVPSGTVKSHLHRGRKLLSQVMKVRGLS